MVAQIQVRLADKQKEDRRLATNLLFILLGGAALIALALWL
jgi:hypothetical protein